MTNRQPDDFEGSISFNRLSTLSVETSNGSIVNGSVDTGICLAILVDDSQFHEEDIVL